MNDDERDGVINVPFQQDDAHQLPQRSFEVFFKWALSVDCVARSSVAWVAKVKTNAAAARDLSDYMNGI